MKHLLILVLLCIAFPCLSFSQNSVTGGYIKLIGIVIDNDSRLPLAYANIGILNKPVGTVSDSTGRFALMADDQILNDTLVISMVGYTTVKRTIQELKHISGPIKFMLNKNTIVLNEVTVSNEFLHTQIVGRQSTGMFLQASIIPKGQKLPIIGAESGLRVQAKHYPALLKDFNFYVSGNNFKFIKFRLNFYSLKNNLPDTLLLNKEVFVDIRDYKTGWNKVDLSAFNIIVKADFALTLQWVDYNRDLKAEPQILIPTAISFSQLNYFRTTSQDKWNKIKASCSYFVSLKY